MSAMCAKFGMSSSDIDLIIVNQNIDADADVEVKKAKAALCKEFALLLPLANVTEGGYSITWNMDAIKIWYRQTSAELGMSDATAPRVRNRSGVW